MQLEFKKFPLNARERRNFIGIKQTEIFVVIIYSFTALLNMILVPMVEEKGCGVKEFLRIASAQSYLNNVTFFFTNLVIGVTIFGVSFIVAMCYQLIAHISGIWLFLLLLFYLMSAIAFTFLLSVAFDSGKWSKFMKYDWWVSTDSIWNQKSLMFNFQNLFSFNSSILCENWRFSVLHGTIFNCFVQWKNVGLDLSSIQLGCSSQGTRSLWHLWHERYKHKTISKWYKEITKNIEKKTF